MSNNSKLTRIFLLLQKAKDKGVLELELFDDNETAGNVRVIKHRLSKIVGEDAIKVVSGRWYLDSEYWAVTKAQFDRDIDRLNRLHTDQKNNLTYLGIVGILSVLVVVAFFIGYSLGTPDVPEMCAAVFGYETTLK